jgi:hypothetical protein
VATTFSADAAGAGPSTQITSRFRSIKARRSTSNAWTSSGGKIAPRGILTFATLKAAPARKWCGVPLAISVIASAATRSAELARCVLLGIRVFLSEGGEPILQLDDAPVGIRAVEGAKPHQALKALDLDPRPADFPPNALGGYVGGRGHRSILANLGSGIGIVSQVRK